jgi:RNA polymerase sigma factor (sigma-70 family)
VLTCRRGNVLKEVHRLFDLGVVSGLSDGQLLDRFLTRRGETSESAFAALVDRHGPMVLRVCRNALSDPHDVEDAFQATFLVLLRKAGSIRNRASCGSWLHGVALRASREIRSASSRRRTHEYKAAAEVASSTRVVEPPDDLRGVLDEELGRLRESYRSPLVLCYLEGHTCEEVARQLGWPVGTVKIRLARGRERLRSRLVRRGLAPTLGLGVGVGLPSPSEASVPHSLCARVAEAVSGGSIPAVVAAVVRGELKRGIVMHAMRLGAVLMGMGFVASAAALMGMEQAGDASKASAGPPPTAPAKAKDEAGPIHVRVVEKDGKGAAGVEVRVFGSGDTSRTFTSDADGRIVLPRDPADALVSFLALKGNALGWGTLDLRGLPPGNRRGPAGTAADPLLLTLLPRNHEFDGSLVDTEGQPIAGVRVAVQVLNWKGQNSVYVRSGQLKANKWPLGASVTDERGRYRLIVPEEASASLMALHPRYVGPWIIAPEAARTLYPVILEPAGGITGTVTDAVTGAPVAGVRVGAQLLDHHEVILRGGGGEALSDAQGRFTLDGLQRGVYNLYLEMIEGRDRAGARAVEGVRVRAGEDATADLKVIEGRPLRGVVIDAATDRPAARVRVGCYGPDGRVTGLTTDQEGRFTFHVPPGEQHVYVMDGSSSSRLSRTIVVVPEQGDMELVQLLRISRPQNWPGAMAEFMKKAANPDVKKRAVEIKIDRPQNKPGAMVEFMKKAANPDVKKQAVEIKTETVYVKSEVANKAAVAKTSAPVRKAPVPEGRTVTGLVVDTQGRPLAGVSVYSNDHMPGEPQRFESATTDREGVFVLRGLPRRDLEISLNRRDCKSATKTLAADRDAVELEYEMLPDPSSTYRRAKAEDEPIPPDLKDRLTFVDLDARGNDFLADGPARGNDLARLPRGVHKMGGTFFRVGEEMIHLRGKMAPQLPESVDGIKVGARADSLHILHATQQGTKTDTEIGSYIVHYADGSKESIPVVYGRNVAGWWLWPRGQPETAPDARIAWRGTNDDTERNPGLSIRLFAWTWTNPHPDRVIATIDATSTNTECDPFLVGLTLERIGPKP